MFNTNNSYVLGFLVLLILFALLIAIFGLQLGGLIALIIFIIILVVFLLFRNTWY